MPDAPLEIPVAADPAFRGLVATEHLIGLQLGIRHHVARDRKRPGNGRSFEGQAIPILNTQRHIHGRDNLTTIQEMEFVKRHRAVGLAFVHLDLEWTCAARRDVAGRDVAGPDSHDSRRGYVPIVNDSLGRILHRDNDHIIDSGLRDIDRRVARDRGVRIDRGLRKQPSGNLPDVELIPA